MIRAPQRAIVYGPVRSRRLGRSLGINLLPIGRKVCNFDCCYCQYGWTDPARIAALTPAELPSAQEALDAVAAALASLAEPPAYLTFSGNGEATLHPEFEAVVDGLAPLRERLAPDARTAILSNSSRVADPRVRRALGRLDERIMKLDVGTEECFHRYNGAPRGLSLDEVVEGLRHLPDVTVQALFTTGPAGNLEAAELEAWLARIAVVRPRRVQLYTLDRGAPCERLVAASRAELEAVAVRLRTAGFAADVY